MKGGLCLVLSIKNNMNFVKGMIFGTMVSAGIMMMYTEGKGMNKKNIMKKGKQTAKKMGIM